jgi:hypothetical protein
MCDARGSSCLAQTADSSVRLDAETCYSISSTASGLDRCGRGIPIRAVRRRDHTPGSNCVGHRFSVERRRRHQFYPEVIHSKLPRLDVFFLLLSVAFLKLFIIA